jgi:hypothetical protein
MVSIILFHILRILSPCLPLMTEALTGLTQTYKLILLSILYQKKQLEPSFQTDITQNSQRFFYSSVPASSYNYLTNCNDLAVNSSAIQLPPLLLE